MKKNPLLSILLFYKHTYTVNIYKKFYILLIFLFLGFYSPLNAESMSLCDCLRKAKNGDFVVTAQGKNFTLFHVFDVDGSTLTIEEISAPLAEKKNIGTNWQQWIDQKAPGSTSWVIYELDLDSKSIEDIYSYSQKSWQKIYPGDQIFPTLINLVFSKIDDVKRKKAGPRPLPDMIDDRPLWHPPIFLNGKKINGVQSLAYKASWPNDSTELSGKKIEIYLPDKNELIPAYFPFWIQVSNQFAQTKLRVIDSGFNLKSIHSHFPLPPPELISHQFTPNGELIFLIKSHPKFKDFNVFAKCSDSSAPMFSVEVVTYETANRRKAKLVVANQELKNKLKADKLYYFIFEPHECSYMSIETAKPIGIAKQYVQ